MTTKKQRPPRGFLLTEAMAAGAVLAISIGITFTFIAQAKVGQIYAAHRARAVDVARTKIEELATATACSVPAVTVNPANFGMYIGSHTTTTATGTHDFPGTITDGVIVNNKLCYATVSVKYPAANKSSEDRTDGIIGNSKGIVTFTRMWFRPL